MAKMYVGYFAYQGWTEIFEVVASFATSEEAVSFMDGRKGKWGRKAKLHVYDDAYMTTLANQGKCPTYII